MRASRATRASLAVGALSALAFLLLAGTATEPHVVAADLRVRAAVQAERTPSLERPMHLVTRLGSGFLLLPLSVVALATLWNRERRLAVFVPVTMAGALLLEGLTKWVVAQPRPNLQPDGFPSGHTLAAVVFFGALACGLGTGRRSRAGRRAGAVGSGLVVLAVAYSRLYLDAHWLSDVLGGLTGGGATLVFGLAVLERFWPRPPAGTGGLP
jgi:membrane-associated phospholipid phosphatase